MNQPPQTGQSESEQAPIDSTDAAWVTIKTSLSPDALMGFSKDIEALVRANPYYVFKSWRESTQGHHRLQFRNLSNKQEIDVEMEVQEGPDRKFTLVYGSGLKKSTTFTIEPDDTGSILTIADDYAHLEESERESRLAEVDKSLPAWGEALFVYFKRIKRWSWLPGWRWYMRRFWTPMSPSSRRIVWMLYLITVVEFAFFLFVLLIYVLEQSRS